jgi:hypothetical protein
LGLPLALAGCARGAVVWSPEHEVARRRYRHPGPTSLALVTVRNEGSGNGAHSALLISASERVLFDPAGGWTDPYVPERHDVLHGITPEALERYLAYQASDGYFYVRQEVIVPPEVAEVALAHAKAFGPVIRTQCTVAVSTILRRLPGFEGIRPELLPDRLAAQFARLPGVVTTERRGSDLGGVEREVPA